eukprot:48501-Chlamydomonas_euryale.AAC.1
MGARCARGGRRGARGQVCQKCGSAPEVWLWAHLRTQRSCAPSTMRTTAAAPASISTRHTMMFLSSPPLYRSLPSGLRLRRGGAKWGRGCEGWMR